MSATPDQTAQAPRAARDIDEPVLEAELERDAGARLWDNPTQSVDHLQRALELSGRRPAAPAHVDDQPEPAAHRS